MYQFISIQYAMYKKSPESVNLETLKSLGKAYLSDEQYASIFGEGSVNK